jgi:hypothetical protein
MFGLHFISKYKACNVGSSSVKPDMLDIIATSPNGDGEYSIIISRVADPDWIRIQSVQWIRIRIQEGKNDPQK